MKILAAAGDIGGARAIIPVLELLSDQSEPFEIVDHGYLGKNAHSDWQKIHPELSSGQKSLEYRLKQREYGVFLFSSSVKDTFALNIARLANRFNVPVIHILDNWTNYLARLKNDDLPILYPDIYTVMDKLAYEEAINDGVPENILKITGQPALSSLRKEVSTWLIENRKEKFRKPGLPENKKLIAFISEPVEADQGAGPDSPQYRGYTEKTVLKQFCHYLQPYSGEVQIGLVPHPREDSNALIEVWEQFRGNLDGGLFRINSGREAVFIADGISGMVSILLYEAWLIGKPIISLQPGLRQPHFSFMNKMQGCHYLTESGQWKEKISKWLTEVNSVQKETELRPELNIHADAPKTIYKIIERLLDNSLN